MVNLSGWFERKGDELTEYLGEVKSQTAASGERGSRFERNIVVV